MPPPAPSVVRIDGPWRHMEVHANGIRFHVVEAEPPGPTDTPVSARPLVILLHGFGSFWWSWRPQLTRVTGARIVAVDLRGEGGGRPNTPWLRRVDVGGRHRRADPGPGPFLRDAGRPRRRRAGLLGDIDAAPEA